MRPDPGGAPEETLPPACVVYGAGSFGRLLAGELAALGVEVVAVLDRAAVPPVLHPDAAGLELRDYPVLLGICNPRVSLSGLAGYLDGLGFGELWSPARAFAALGRAGRVREHYWLTTDIGLYEREADRIALAAGRLADERSAAALASLIRYRTTGDIDALPDVDPPERQYLPADLDFIDGPVSLLDAGAYDGDTVRAFLAAGVDLETVVAFEPDPASFDRLARELAGHAQTAGVALPLAVGRRTELLRFAANGTTGARLSESGETVIQCVSLDDALHGWRPTHVKLDIEGTEPDAIVGMSDLLDSVRPRLAICAYHRPDHLWALLLQLAELDLGYRFHLRCYGEQCFDSVLYAVPA